MAQVGDWAHCGRGCPMDVTKRKEPHTAVPGLRMIGSQGTVRGNVRLCAVVFRSHLAICLQLLLEIGYWVGHIFGLNQSASSPVQWQEMSVLKVLNSNNLFSEKVQGPSERWARLIFHRTGQMCANCQDINWMFNNFSNQILPFCNE